MGAGPLAFPMQLASNGTILTREPGSDDEVRDAIRVIIETRPGERPIFEDFGLADPTFEGLEASDVQAILNEYGPEGVTVLDFEVVSETETVQSVTLPFVRDDAAGDADEEDWNDVTTADDEDED